MHYVRLLTNGIVRFSHDQFQAHRHQALLDHGAATTVDLPPGVRQELRTEFNQYTSLVRTTAAYELRDVLAQEGGEVSVVTNIDDLDLDKLDYDADAVREIDTLVDRSTHAADLAAALAAGHIDVDQYAQQVAHTDLASIDPALLDGDDDEDEEDEDATAGASPDAVDSSHESDDSMDASDDDLDDSEAEAASSDSEAGPGSDHAPVSDASAESEPEPESDAEFADEVRSDTRPPPKDDPVPVNEFFPPHAGPFHELQELLASTDEPGFLDLFNAMTVGPPDDMRLGFRPGDRPTSSGACPVCSIDLRSRIPPNSTTPIKYVPPWASHVVACRRRQALQL